MTHSLKQRVIWWICWSLYGLFFRLILRARVTGAENIPREGPVLVLANHTSLLDPPNVGIPIRGMVAMAINGVPTFGPQEVEGDNAVEGESVPDAKFWYGHANVNGGWHFVSDARRK